LWTEIADERIDVLFECVRIGDVGPDKDDVGRGRSCGPKAGLDVSAGLLYLHPQVAFTDNVPVLIDGRLPTNIYSLPAALDRDDHRGRVSCTWRSDDPRFGLGLSG